MEDTKVQQAITDAGFVPRDYSGRGMYGTYCLAIESDDDPCTTLLSIVGAFALLAETVDEVRELAEALKDCRTDTLGRGTIIYWPRIEWVDAEEEEKE